MRNRPWLKSYPADINWDQPFTAFPFYEIIERAAASYGEATYLDFMGQEFSFLDIEKASNCLAKGLQKIGVKKGDKIGVLMPNCPQFVIAFFGVLKAGATVVNFSPMSSTLQARFQSEDSGMSRLLTSDSETFLKKAKDIASVVSLEAVIVSPLSEALPMSAKLRNTISAWRLPKKDLPSNFLAWRELMANDGVYEIPPIVPERENALLQYTGGTTGEPKGAMLSHANLSINVQQMLAWNTTLKPGEGSVLAALPLSHVFGLIAVMAASTLNGSKIIMLPEFCMELVEKTIERCRPDIIPVVPTLYNALLDIAERRPGILSSFRRALSGGAPLSHRLQQRIAEAMPHVELSEGYGLTETSPVIAATLAEGINKPGSVGLPLPCTDVRIANPDNPRLVLDNEEVGEICVRGPQVMRGYQNRPDENAEAFYDGWFRTGDLGYMDSDGYLFVVGRLKEMIISGGLNVYPFQIENAILEHPGIKTACVIGVPDRYYGERPKAFVIRTTDYGSLDARDLTEYLKTRLGKHEIPREIEFRDELPLTPIGKLSKKTLEEEERNRYEAKEAMKKTRATSTR